MTSALSTDDAVALGSGATFWTTRAVPSSGIQAITVADGPHGLRAQGDAGDHLGLTASRPATCFPTASALASSWDVGLAAEVGQAIGLEAVDQGIHVVLGPGVNMKRSPLCGRNFEYFSEDPYLAGKLAAAWIRGVQSTGTGTSLKHFALNNQELQRMTTDVRVDPRALREYYLPAFEIAVAEADPATVMTAYNRVEGTYCSEHPLLVQQILREEWGFGGAVLTDWGGINDRVAAYRAGVDLEMPGRSRRYDAPVQRALADGDLDEQVVVASARRVAALAERTSARDVAVPADLVERHHALARRAAAASGVLLKNDRGLLPLPAGRSVAVIGALAEQPRYQGAGSSRVNPTRVVSLLDGVRGYGPATWARGYSLADVPDDALVAEAVALAAESDVVVACVGLTDSYESEGFDREHLRIPSNQVALLEALAPYAERVAVVLVGGSAVEMPWEGAASAILHQQLAGQAQGAAAADLLFGAVNPSGRLAESYPMVYEDLASAPYYGVDRYQTPYLESLYCGYRWFDTARLPVRYPFGHGLSYTTFAHTDLDVAVRAGHVVEVRVTVTNTGDRAGAEVLQLYVAPRTGGAHRPEQELKGFAKLELEPGESQEVTLRLDRRSFATWNEEVGDWQVEAGSYEIRVGASSRDIRQRATVELDGVEPVDDGASTWYHQPGGTPTMADFLTVHEEFPPVEAPRRGTFDLDSSLAEMKDASMLCRLLHALIRRTVAKRYGGTDRDDPQFAMMLHAATGLPIRVMPRMSEGAMPDALPALVVESANGRTWRGIRQLVRRR